MRKIRRALLYVSPLASMCLLVAFAVYAYGEISQRLVLVESFTVPDDYKTRGLDSAAVSNMVVDRIHRMQSNVSERSLGAAAVDIALAADRRATDLAADFRVPKTTVSLRTMIDLIQRLRHQDPQIIRGHIAYVRPPDGVSREAATIQITFENIQGGLHRDSGSEQLKNPDAEALIDAFADHILRSANPYVFALYTRRIKHDLVGAIAIVRDITQDPRNRDDRLTLSRAYNLWGHCLVYLTEPDEAISKYAMAVQLDPAFALPHNGLGNALAMKNDVAGAMVEYEKSFALDGTLSLPLVNEAAVVLAEVRGGRMPRASLDDVIAKCRKAATVEPTDATSHNVLGHCLREKRDRSGAIAEYQNAIKLDPRFAAAHAGLGNAYKEQGQLAEAIAEYQRAYAINWEFDGDNQVCETYDNWSAALRQLGRYEDANEALTRKANVKFCRPGR